MRTKDQYQKEIMTCYLAYLMLLTSLPASSGFQTESVNFEQNTEIVYIVSGSEDFIASRQYKRNIKEIIRATSGQLDPHTTRAGVLFAWDGHYVELVSEITTVAMMHKNLETWFAVEHDLESEYETESSDVVAYARDRIFSKENNNNNLNQLLIIQIPSDLGNSHIIRYLQDICTKIITFVLVQPIGEEVCTLSSVRKRQDYINMLLNYTKLLNQKQALCFEDMTKVAAVHFRKVVQTAIDTHNNEVEKYCALNPHLTKLKDTGLLKCTGFFCRANPILWISLGAVLCAAMLLIVISLTACKIYHRKFKRPSDYYSFLAPALAYHNKFLMAQSRCLYDSSIFQVTSTTKMRKPTRPIFESATTSGATTKTHSTSNSPANERPPIQKRFQKAPGSRRMSLSSGSRTLTTVTPKYSAPSSRRASIGVTAPAFQTPSSRRPSVASVGSRKFSRRKSTASLGIKLEGASSVRMLKQCSEELIQAPVAVHHSKHKMSGVKKNIKRSLTREHSTDDVTETSRRNSAPFLGDVVSVQIHSEEQLNPEPLEPEPITSMPTENFETTGLESSSDESNGGNDLDCISEGSSENAVCI